MWHFWKKLCPNQNQLPINEKVLNLTTLQWMAQQTSIWNRLSVWMCSFMHNCLIVLPWASLFSHIRSSLLHFLGLHCSHYSGPHWDMSHLGRLQEKSSDAQECVRFTENWVSKSTTTEQLFGGVCRRKSWHFQLLPSMTKHDFRKTLQFPFYVLVPQYNSKTCFNEHCSPIQEQMTRINQLILKNQTHTA